MSDQAPGGDALRDYLDCLTGILRQVMSAPKLPDGNHRPDHVADVADTHNREDRTMTSTAIRTYTVGDSPDEYVYAPTSQRNWCGEPMQGGYVCSIHRGHEGPQHVAANVVRVCAVKDREGHTVTSTAIRTYSAGDPTDDYVYNSDSFDWCGKRFPSPGYVCSIRSGHEGPQHVAATSVRVEQVMDREQPVPETSTTPETGTWKPGDQVQRHGHPEIAVGVVLHATDTDVHLIGRGSGDGAFRLIKTTASSLDPYTGDLPAPTLADIGTALVTKAAALDERVTRTQGLLDQLSATHNSFRDQVRELAIEKAEELNWCTPGLNAALDELGLERKTTTFTAEVTIAATRTITVEVQADDVDEVYTLVDNMSEDDLSRAYEEHSGLSFDRGVLDQGEWTLDSHSVEEVNEA